MCYKIVKMSEENVENVIDVEQECFTNDWRSSLLKKELYNENAHYVVVLKEEEVIGYAGYWAIVDEAEIMNIAVLPKYQGKKIGDILMKDIISSSKEKNLASISLEVLVDNEKAINLYKKYGFETYRTIKKYMKNKDAYAMRKYL